MRPRPDSPPDTPATLSSSDTRSREELLAELNYLRMENAYLKKLKALAQDQALPKKRKPSGRRGRFIHGIGDYIHYYNHHRIKLKLKGLSPVQYGTQP